jgi:hypothetical protein
MAPAILGLHLGRQGVVGQRRAIFTDMAIAISSPPLPQNLLAPAPEQGCHSVACLRPQHVILR